MNAVLAELKSWNTDKLYDHNGLIRNKYINMLSVREKIIECDEINNRD